MTQRCIAAKTLSFSTLSTIALSQRSLVSEMAMAFQVDVFKDYLEHAGRLREINPLFKMSGKASSKNWILS
jgi:hypothetical protein